MSKSLNVLTTFVVFGVYTHGALAGKVNPRAFCEISIWGESFKECKAKLVNQTDGAFYRVKSVVDHSKPLPMTGFVATLTEAQKELALDYRGDDTVGVSDEQKIEAAKTLEEVLEIVGG